MANHLLLWIFNSFGSIAMVNYPYPANFLANLPAYPVKLACSLVLNSSTPLIGLAQAAGLFYNGTDGKLPCYNITDEFTECADQTGCGTGPEGMSWDYQACSEIIYFPNTNNITDMFPPRNWSSSNLTEYCQTTWGIIPRPDWLSIYFGVDLKYTSRIILSNGLLDPWHGGGFLQSLSDSVIAVIIPEGAHHLDLRGSDPLDPVGLIEARNKEKSYLKQWLSQIRVEKKIQD